MSIAATDASKAEGNTGTTSFTFTVTRTGDTSGTATVDYAVTGSGTNPADAADFGGTLPTGTATFAANADTATITINVSGDAVAEPDEGFTVTLSNPTGGLVLGTNDSADGTIVDDDTGIDLSVTTIVAPTTVAPNGTATYTVTVTNNATATQTATGVSLTDTLPAEFSNVTIVSTTEGTATVGVANSQTIVAGINAEIQPDGADTVGNSSGINTFNGGTSTLFFYPEGSGNGNFAAFTVADFTPTAVPDATGLSSIQVVLEEDPRGFAVAGTFSVYLAANTDPNLIDPANNPNAGEPAFQAGNDGLAAIDPAFGAINDGTPLGTATFTPTGAGNQTIVTITLDGTATGSEFATFLDAVQNGTSIRLLFAANEAATAATFAGQGNGDGAPPTLAFAATTTSGANDISWTGIDLAPGESATLTYTVNVGPTPGAYANFAQVTAADQFDFDSTPANGTPPTPAEDDEATATVTVSAAAADLSVAITDGTDPIVTGGNTVYTVVITNNGPDAVTGAALDNTIVFPTGTFTVSDESALTFSGGGSGTRVIAADGPDITGLNLASGETVTLTYTVTADTGTGTLTNTATVSGGTPVDTTAANDTAVETTTVTALPTLSVDDVTAAEGTGATPTAFTFTVTRSGTTTAASSATYTVTGTGTNPANAADFGGAFPTGTVNFAAGETSQTITIDVTADATVESDETFNVTLSAPTGATLDDDTGLGTITNDDLPALSIDDATMAEGDAGTTTFTFTVSLSEPAPAGGVTFDIATADGTATAGTDYVANSQTGVTIAGGNSSTTFAVTVNGDTDIEPDETFTVNVTSVTGATVADGQGTGTITTDDFLLVRPGRDDEPGHGRLHRRGRTDLPDRGRRQWRDRD